MRYSVVCRTYRLFSWLPPYVSIPVYRLYRRALVPTAIPIRSTYPTTVVGIGLPNQVCTETGHWVTRQPDVGRHPLIPFLPRAVTKADTTSTEIITEQVRVQAATMHISQTERSLRSCSKFPQGARSPLQARFNERDHLKLNPLQLSFKARSFQGPKTLLWRLQRAYGIAI